MSDSQAVLSAAVGPETTGPLPLVGQQRPWPQRLGGDAQSGHRPTLGGGGLQGTKFLVIDDDVRNTYAMRALLEGRRASVLVAASGRDGLLLLAKTPGIDIVLMDIMMPDMDGYETIRILRTISRFQTLPIIAVTGKVVDGERERCLAAGANGYVPKPVDPAHLLTVVGPWLRDPTPFA